ncbi:MAG: DUF364 domain-containing protein [Vallitalea sp.]|jgi:hypothetical protein|nr:DUF364 domain-containing protein [Vallitalea sp.]
MILENIKQHTLQNFTKEDDLFIRGIWSVDCLFNPNLNERTFNYKFLVVQNEGQGSAYSLVRNYPLYKLEQIMGKHYFDLKINDTALEIAILDAIYSSRASNNYEIVEIQGNSIEKSVKRAEIIAQETLKLVDTKEVLVVNVGVVGNIIKCLLDHNVNVVGTDFDEKIVGKKLFDKVEVMHGDYTNDIIRKADVAIITGMTLATNTLDKIIKTAKENDTKTIIFAETGSNLYDFFIDAGIDVVISEPFPFYIYQGKTQIKIIKNKAYSI